MSRLIESGKLFFLPIIGVLSIAAAMVFFSAKALEGISEQAIMNKGEATAVLWAQILTERVPQAFEGPEISDATDHLILDLLSSSPTIFRIKLFNMDGETLFVSDAPNTDLEADLGDEESSLEVIISGETEIKIEDGTGRPDRPSRYLEVYVPATNADGDLIGVMEVYVDATQSWFDLNVKFQRWSNLIILINAIIFIVPALFLVIRTNQLRRRDRKLLEVSRYDQLTGTLIRSSFTDASVGIFNRRGDEGPDIGLLFIDVDKFKTINDDYGHKVGDDLLRHVAATIRAVVRSHDIVGRIGGDEFVVLIDDVDITVLHEIGDRIVQAHQQPVHLRGVTLYPSLSIGAHLSPAGESYDQASHAADIALYRAKEIGRGRVVDYDEALDKRLQRRRWVEHAVRDGLKTERFYLEFQPIFDSGRTLQGFEALLRLRCRNGESISPAEFIPVAERSGLIDDIGLWTLRQAVALALPWPSDLFVAVNLSALQFKSGLLAQKVAAILENYGFDPSRLELEVTESTLLQDDDQVNNQISELTQLGVRFALDDFGTGYSSLGYIWKYDFAKIKIDRSFVQGLEGPPAKYCEAISIISLLGQRLGMDVTIEGVETEAQLQTVIDLGCEQVQGFYLGRPKPIEDIGIWLDADRSWSAERQDAA